MRQVDLRLGKAHELHGLGDSIGNQQRLGIGIADILRRKNHHTASDESRIFSPSSIRASQYNAPFGSESRRLLM